MGIYRRADSQYWWIYDRHTKQRYATDILVGTTTAQRKDSRQLAEDLFFKKSSAQSARVHRLPSAIPAIRFSKYAVDYQTNTVVHHKGRQREEEILVTLVRFFGTDSHDTRDVLLSLIDRDLTKTYMTWRRSAGVTASAINREVDLLKSMLREACPKYLSESPLVGMPRLRIVKPRRRRLQPGEDRKLLKVATHPQDRAILILGWDIMARLGDLLDLRRSDRHGLWVNIVDPKNEEGPLEVPLSKRAAAALDAIPNDGPYYFSKFRKAANSRDWPGSVRQRLEYLCRLANLPYGRRQGGITFHWATRTTSATHLLMKKRVPLPTVQKLGGWKSPAMLLEIYTEADKDDLLAAVGQKAPKRRRA